MNEVKGFFARVKSVPQKAFLAARKKSHHVLMMTKAASQVWVGALEKSDGRVMFVRAAAEKERRPVAWWYPVEQPADGKSNRCLIHLKLI